MLSAPASRVRVNGVQMLRSLGLDAPSPPVTQLPTLALFGVAVVMNAVVPSLEATSEPGLATAALIMVAITWFAVVVTARPALERHEIIIPAADFIAFAALGALVWVVVPLLIAADFDSNTNEMFRAAFNLFAFGSAAAVVSELSRQARKQLHLVRIRKEAATFVILLHARVRAGDGLVSYADTGHGLTLVVRAEGTAGRLSCLDVPLGTIGDADCARLETALGRGEMIVSFSDGVLDLYDGILAAVDEVAAIARSSSSARELADATASVARLEPNPDDVTIVALRRDV